MMFPYLPTVLRSVLAIAVASAPSLATRVAVLDFESGTESGSLQFLSQTLPNALVEPLSAQPGIEVVERSQVARILQERQLALTGASLSDSTLSLLPADILVMGQFSGGMDALRMQVRLVESGTGTVKGAFSRSGTLQEVLAAMPTIAAQVAQAARGENTGTLSIHTRPAGATVLLDGRLLGRTPLVDQKIAVGAHALRIELPGHCVWSDSVTIAAATPVERTIELEADDDRSGVWIQGGGSMGAFARGFEDPSGPFWSGDLALLARSRRLGVQLGFELPTERSYDVTYPVPWSTRSDTRTLSGPIWSLQVVGDVLQAGAAAFHLGAGVTYSSLDISPRDLSDADDDSKSIGLLGGIASAGARWRLHPAMEILAEAQAGSSFNEVEVVDIAERDLFVARTTATKFTLQTWSARIAARFRIQ
jgi:TolB-like protein